jgi:hypothetical protein
MKTPLLCACAALSLSLSLPPFWRRDRRALRCPHEYASTESWRLFMWATRSANAVCSHRSMLLTRTLTQPQTPAPAHARLHLSCALCLRSAAACIYRHHNIDTSQHHCRGFSMTPAAVPTSASASAPAHQPQPQHQHHTITSGMGWEGMLTPGVFNTN